jgi:hypothetical protein
MLPALQQDDVDCPRVAASASVRRSLNHATPKRPIKVLQRRPAKVFDIALHHFLDFGGKPYSQRKAAGSNRTNTPSAIGTICRRGVHHRGHFRVWPSTANVRRDKWHQIVDRLAIVRPCTGADVDRKQDCVERFRRRIGAGRRTLRAGAAGKSAKADLRWIKAVGSGRAHPNSMPQHVLLR